MAVRVFLEVAQGGIPNLKGEVLYFVCIEGVPYSKGHAVCNAQPLKMAEKIKKEVEAALRAYGRAERLPRSKSRTRYERIR